MSRKITVRNPHHPHNQMKAAGERARKAARKMSNEELDNFIRTNALTEDSAKQALALTRAAKIKLLGVATCQEFANLHNAAVAKKEAEAKEAQNA